MCIRDRIIHESLELDHFLTRGTDSFAEAMTYLPDGGMYSICLLYTSDAADERSSVDLGGRRIIKKKNNADAWSHEQN